MTKPHRRGNENEETKGRRCLSISQRVTSCILTSDFRSLISSSVSPSSSSEQIAKTNRAIYTVRMSQKGKMGLRIVICAFVLCAYYQVSEGRLEPTKLVHNGLFKLQNQHDGRVSIIVHILKNGIS
jgi:hypothetical protein